MAILLLLAGCGYVGEPLPPLLNIPARVTDLTVEQRGGRVILRFSPPSTTTEGMPLKAPVRVEVRGGPAAQPFDANAWVQSSEVIGMETPAAPWIGKEVVFGVKVFGDRGQDAGWSNFVVAKIVAAPERPSELTAEPVPNGVRLRWQGSAPAYRVYRRAGDTAVFTLAAEPAGAEWIDTGAEYGAAYFYYVEGAANGASSEVSAAVSITPADRFAPAVPSGLTALATGSSIELVWERNGEADLSAYRVYRDPGNVAEESAAPAFSDKKIEPGKTYRYTISALDKSGNESVRSAAVEITAPLL